MDRSLSDGSVVHWPQLDKIWCLSVFFECQQWQVSPTHPMSSPALVIKGDGLLCMIFISANGTLYRRNTYSVISPSFKGLEGGACPVLGENFNNPSYTLYQHGP